MISLPLSSTEIKKARLCQNHLAQFYEAVKRGDLKVVERIEHELTPAEECVACAYLFKAKGATKKELERFLIKEGFCQQFPRRSFKLQNTVFLISRIGIFLGTFLICIIAFTFIWSVFKGPVAISTISPIVAVVILPVSVAIFYLVSGFLE